MRRPTQSGRTGLPVAVENKPSPRLHRRARIEPYPCPQLRNKGGISDLSTVCLDGEIAQLSHLRPIRHKQKLHARTRAPSRQRVEIVRWRQPAVIERACGLPPQDGVKQRFRLGSGVRQARLQAALGLRVYFARPPFRPGRNVKVFDGAAEADEQKGGCRGLPPIGAD